MDMSGHITGVSSDMGFAIKLKHQFHGVTLDVDINSSDGGVTGIFGPSGSGKTSLVNAIAGLFRPDQARVNIGGRVLVDTQTGVFVPPRQRRAGYVFQDGRLFPHMNVRDNLCYGTRFAPKGQSLDPVVEVLGLGHLLKRKPAYLSGGEVQRVAIGRALMMNPDFLLMDEPLSSLDPDRRDEILPYLDRLKHHAAIQIFYVSHEMSELARLADTLVLMRDGKVTRHGPAADLFADPKAVPHIGVRAAGATLDATLSLPDAGDGLSTLTTSRGTLFLPRIDAPAGTALRVRIKASDIILAKRQPRGVSALNILPAKITALHEGDGPGVAVALTSGTDRLVARITRRSAQALGLAEGMECFAIVKSVSVGSENIGQVPGRPETA